MAVIEHNESGNDIVAVEHDLTASTVDGSRIFITRDGRKWKRISSGLSYSTALRRGRIEGNRIRELD